MVSQAVPTLKNCKYQRRMKKGRMLERSDLYFSKEHEISAANHQLKSQSHIKPRLQERIKWISRPIIGEIGEDIAGPQIIRSEGPGADSGNRSEDLSANKCKGDMHSCQSLSPISPTDY